MEKYELRMFANRQAMYYGLFFGLFLVLKFVFEVAFDGGVGAFISGVLTIMVPVFAYKCAVLFKRKVEGSETGFGLFLRFTIYLFFFASMFLALAQFIYYQYINPDYIQHQVDLLVSAAEQIKGAEEQVRQLKDLIAEAGVPSASTVAIQTVWIFIILGLILGLPIAAIVNKNGSRDKDQGSRDKDQGSGVKENY